MKRRLNLNKPVLEDHATMHLTISYHGEVGSAMQSTICSWPMECFCPLSTLTKRVGSANRMLRRHTASLTRLSTTHPNKGQAQLLEPSRYRRSSTMLCFTFVLARAIHAHGHNNRPADERPLSRAYPTVSIRWHTKTRSVLRARLLILECMTCG